MDPEDTNGPFADIVSFRGLLPDLPPAPLTTFRGYLKRIASDPLSDDRRTALDLAAPYFSTRLLFKNELDALRAFIYCGRKRAFDAATPLPRHAARRYAGGDDLDRGRYYTIAKDANGDDGGTLQSELAAYQEPHWSGMTLVADSACLHNALPEGGLRRALTRFSRSLCLCFFNTADAPHRFFWQPGPTLVRYDLMQRDTDGGVRGLVFAIPYEVEHREINGVLDLRERPAQDWLVDLAKSGKIPPISLAPHHTFFDLLRHLVSPINGGGMVTEIIGACLRRLDISGLVFPSARADGSAQYHEGQLRDFDGWNFLDLRAAALHADVVAIDCIEAYELPVVEFLETTDFSVSGVARGSWRRSGVARQYAQIHAEDLVRIRSESKVERENRIQDYRSYWKTLRLLADAGLRSYLANCMAACGLRGAPEDISPRMWQYVLGEVDLDLRIPRLADASRPVIPLDLRLIGWQ